MKKLYLLLITTTCYPMVDIETNVNLNPNDPTQSKVSTKITVNGKIIKKATRKGVNQNITVKLSPTILAKSIEGSLKMYIKYKESDSTIFGIIRSFFKAPQHLEWIAESYDTDEKRDNTTLCLKSVTKLENYSSIEKKHAKEMMKDIAKLEIQTTRK